MFKIKLPSDKLQFLDDHALPLTVCGAVATSAVLIANGWPILGGLFAIPSLWVFGRETWAISRKVFLVGMVVFVGIFALSACGDNDPQRADAVSVVATS